MGESAPEAAAKAAGKVREGAESAARQEMNVLGRELMGLLRQTGTGVALLSGAAVLAGLAAGSANTLLLRVLETFLPPRAAALALALVELGGTAALAYYAQRRLVDVRDISRETIGSVGDELGAGGED